MQKMHVGVIGAGIVGLSTALWLQKEGFQVTLIDKDAPGMGASFGNAGLFADYGRLPFAKFSMLRKMPGMLLDKTSPLSVQARYLPSLLPYGWAFFKACFPAKYSQGKQAMRALQEHASDADNALLELTQSQHLVRASGCLGLFATQEGFANAQQGDLRERQEQGVNLAFLSANEVRELEPDLATFYAGGVHYPETRFTVSPVELSRRYAQHFAEQGGVFVQDEVKALHSDAQQVSLHLSSSVQCFDQVALCTGVASKALLKGLGIAIPLVSERGYHLTLNADDKQVSRPVGWLDKAVFLTPMADGVRLAGTAEYADADAPFNHQRTQAMLQHASTMLGQVPEIKSTWVGSRPSMPDTLPVIGALADHPRIKVAFGHGHLGLTFAAISAQLLTECIQGKPTTVDLQPFSAQRFN